MLFLHNFDEHLVRDHKILMPSDDFPHPLVMFTLFFFRALATANINVIPVERMKCFDGFSHTPHLYLAIASRSSLPDTLNLL